jgi:hypothetical protein
MIPISKKATVQNHSADEALHSLQRAMLGSANQIRDVTHSSRV